MREWETPCTYEQVNFLDAIAMHPRMQDETNENSKKERG